MKRYMGTTAVLNHCREELERLREENAGYLIQVKAWAKEVEDYQHELERLRAQLSAQNSQALENGYYTHTDLARLRRIEEAARDWLEHPHEQAVLNALRTALEKDPDREFTSGRETFPFGEEV